MNIKFTNNVLITLIAAGIFTCVFDIYSFEQDEEQTQNENNHDKEDVTTEKNDATQDAPSNDETDDNESDADEEQNNTKVEENEDFKSVALDFIKGEYNE